MNLYSLVVFALKPLSNAPWERTMMSTWSKDQAERIGAEWADLWPQDIVMLVEERV